jgi:hypothetical protein
MQWVFRKPWTRAKRSAPAAEAGAATAATPINAIMPDRIIKVSYVRCLNKFPNADDWVGIR